MYEGFARDKKRTKIALFLFFFEKSCIYAKKVVNLHRK